MRAIAFPNSNIIFNVQLRDPGAQTKKELATSPFDYVAWGSTVYPGWLAIDQAAVAITETAALLIDARAPLPERTSGSHRSRRLEAIRGGSR